MERGLSERPSVLRRVAAAVALLASAVAGVVLVVEFIRRPLVLPVIVLALLVTILAAWVSLVTRGARRIAATVVALAVLVGLLVFLGGRTLAGTAIVFALMALSTVAARVAFGNERALVASGTSGRRVRAARRGVLLMNPWSGGSKVTALSLPDEARRRGLEPVLLQEGDDLRALAEGVVARGADVIGMAGGDGSQALVADVARIHDIAFVCVPAGTRNHFALDLGLDRTNVTSALDAFGEAVERRVDLATIGGRVFVNNASLGIYATIVGSEDYRAAKLVTAVSMLPDLVGPASPQFDLRFDGPDGVRRASADVLLVSNNRYAVRTLAGVGTRPRLDGGVLGVVAVHAAHAGNDAKFLPTVEEWTARTFRVDAEHPVPVGLDGEAFEIEPPLEFASLPGALRVRLPRTAPGASHTTVYGVKGTVTALVRILMNRPA